MAKAPMWTLTSTLDLLRALQQEVAPTGYHLALGGGVLNKGESYKDLDIYFLPRLSEPSDRGALIKLLRSRFTDEQEIGSGGEDNEQGVYSYKSQFLFGKRRIDVFIVKED